MVNVWGEGIKRGPPGPPGEEGPPGKKGPKGDPGSGKQGEKGDKGIKGDKGDTGKQGTSGVPGKDGSIGPTGHKGDTGEHGLPGIQGLTGKKGDKGETGSIGPYGPPGHKGDQGIQGRQGETGERGDPVHQGIQGRQGETGEQGKHGDLGKQGVPGKHGDPGRQGVPGVRGEHGDPGHQGIQGRQGETGEQGIQGKHGDQGDQGTKGKDALQLIQWFPHLTIQWWRDSSDASYYFEDKNSGFTKKDGKITGLKSHDKFLNNDAKSLKDVGKLKQIPKGFSLEFKNSLYYIKNENLGEFEPMTSGITISFFVPKLPSQREYLISTTKNYRGLSIENTKIQVWGCKNEPIEVPLITGWNIVFIQWKDGGDNAGYIRNTTTTKTFVTSKPPSFDMGIYIGGQKNGNNFNGSICAFDLSNPSKSYPEVPTNIPTEIVDLLIKDHYLRTTSGKRSHGYQYE